MEDTRRGGGERDQVTHSDAGVFEIDVLLPQAQNCTETPAGCASQDDQRADVGMHLIGHSEKGRDRCVIDHGAFRIALGLNSVCFERMVPKQGSPLT